MRYLLETKTLGKRYGAQWALDGVSVHVPAGAVYGLVGPNGAGKSTLLKIITGMMKASEGEVLFDGAPWTRACIHDMGALIEAPAIYPNLTAEENLRVHTLMMGQNDSNIKDTLEMVGLDSVGRKKSGDFSLGMKERLGIALALVGRPRLLLLDEPTNGLDPIGMNELRVLLRQLAFDGTSVVLSSHILGEVAESADYIGMLYEGRLIYEGRAKQNEDLEALFMRLVQEERAR